MKTIWLLMARHEGRPFILVDDVCREYFPHLDTQKLIRKIGAGDIRLPLTRMEASQKSAKGVNIHDLAAYLDARFDAARTELRQITE
jgi:hypothetical protein